MKTFLEESVSEIIANHTDLEDLVIVLPSRRAGVFFKEALVNQLSNPILSPKIFSIEEFIQEVSTLKLVAPTTVLIEFYQIYFSNTPKEFMDSFEEFIQWAPPLLKDFSDLDAYLVDVRSAFNNLSSYYALETLLDDDSTYKKKQHFWNSLTKYFECHKDSLYSKGFGTLGMLYREAVDSVEIYLQNTNKPHYFIGFNALNTAEASLFQAFLEADRAIVLWDIDQYFYKDLQHAAGRFIQRHHKEWTYYRQKGKIKFPSNFEKPKDIKIVGIPKNIGQAKYAASIIKNSYKDLNSLSKTALVLGNESILIPVLSGLPEEIDQWNVTMGYPLINTSVASFFNHFFEMHLKSTPLGCLYSDFLRVVSFDWIHEVLNLNTKDGSAFLKKISKSNKKFLGPKELQFILKHPVGILIFSPFDSVKNFVQRILDFTLALQNNLKKKDVLEYKLYPTFLTLIQELIQQLFNMGKTLESIDTVRGIHYLWNELIQTLSVDYKGNPLGGVQIMGMLETRVLDFDSIILTNLNEGILPKGRSSQSVFPFVMKKNIGLPTFLDNDAIYTYHFYRLIQRASSITLIYNTESDGLNSGEPSRFIHQLRFLGLDQHKVTEHFESASTKKTILNKLEVHKTPEVLAILHSKAREGFSASSLGTYLIDPLKFYTEKILGVATNQTFNNTLSPMDGGTIAHRTLKDLYEPYLNKPLKASDYSELKKKTPALLLEHYRSVFGGDEVVSGKSRLMLFALEQSILNIFQVEKEKISKGNSLTIIALEKEFNYTLDVPGIGEIFLRGSIDRLDRYNGVLRIVDYKSGKVDPAKLKIADWNSLKGDEKRRSIFQILFYSHAEKSFLKTEQELIAGIISFKNTERYVLPFGMKSKGNKNYIHVVNQEIILSYESFLIELIQEIFDISKPFTTLEE